MATITNKIRSYGPRRPRKSVKIIPLGGLDQIGQNMTLIECEDEIDPEQLIDKANHDVHRFDTGYEAIEGVLQGYEKQYGFEYKVQPNACGTETVNMDLQEELE